MALVALAGCGSSSGGGSSAIFERAFMENCRKDGTPSDRCGCVFNYLSARAADAGKAPQDFSPSPEDEGKADRECR